MHRFSQWIPALFVAVAAALGASPAASPASNDSQATAGLVALDVALQPDPAVLTQIQTGASRVLKEKRLPAEQRLEIGAAPRITLVQRFVRSRDLQAIHAALDKVAGTAGMLPVKLIASGYTSSEAGGRALVVVTLDPSPELERLARAAVEAVQPFAVSGGTSSAFVRSAGEDIDSITIRTVEEFVPRLSGSSYVPYLSLGMAHPEFVKALREAAFNRLRFNGLNLATYHLGQFGTAQKRLWGSSRAGVAKSGS